MTVAVGQALPLLKSPDHLQEGLVCAEPGELSLVGVGKKK